MNKSSKKSPIKELDVLQWMGEADVSDDIQGLKKWIDDLGEALSYKNFKLSRQIGESIIKRVKKLTQGDPFRY